MSRTEDLLRETLRARVDDAEYSPTTMRTIVSTAAAMQRRRRVLVGVAAAAAIVAVTVPTALVVDRVRESGPAPATNAPTPTPSHQSVGTPSPTTATTPPAGESLADLPQGAAPRLSYLDGNVFVTDEGVRTTLPLDDVSGATPYRGGFLVSVPRPGLGPQIVWLDNELQEAWRQCGQGGFAVSADRLSTVYVGGPCDIMGHKVYLGGTTGMGEAELSEPLPREIQVPVGVFDGAAVTAALPDEGGWITDFSGKSRRIPGLSLVAGVSQQSRLFSGQVVDPPETGAVVDADSGKTLWAAPGWFVTRFSPDGSRVLALRSDSGNAVGWGLFDARSGDSLGRYDVPAGFVVHDLVWEDDEHVLMSVTEGSSTALVRSTLDGELERATEVVRTRGEGLVFAAQP